MKDKKYDVLYVVNVPKETTFMKKDFEILQKNYNVNKIFISKYNPFSLIKLFFEMRKAKVVFCWWGNIESAVLIFFSKMLKVKTLIQGGGIDVENFPKMKYGDMRLPVVKNFIKYAFNNADKVMILSEDSKKNLMINTKVKNAIVNYLTPDNKFGSPIKKKEDIILTVATIQKDVILKKGLDIFAECARYFPDKKFIIVGMSKENIELFRSKYSSNIEMYGMVSHDELISFYSKSKIYCQLSFIESFGLALAEAMLASCIPIVSKNGSLPEVVGDTGFMVDYGNVEQTVDAINKALTLDISYGAEAREHILKSFSSEKREKIFLETIDGLIKESK